MNDEQPRSITPRFLFGMLAAGIGALLLLQNLGVLGELDLSSWWPLAIVAFGVIKMIWAPSNLARLTGLLIAGFGGLFLLARLRPDLLETETVLESLWPTALLFGGLFVALRALRPSKSSTDSAGPEDTTRGFVMWAGQERHVTSQSYRGGELTAIMGGYELDLREASTDAEGATIELLVVMGGIEMKVPRDWRVSLDLTTLLGASVDKTRRPEGDSKKVLRVRGLVLMGGVEVSS